MEDKFEKKIKAFLPYIIIIAAVYLFVPALLVIFKNTMALNYIVLIGILPLTTLLCCMHYSFKKENDIFLALVAPVVWIPSMFLYGIIRDSVLRAFIYLVAYFICGYLGLLLGDILNPKFDSWKGKRVRQKQDELLIDGESGRSSAPSRIRREPAETESRHGREAAESDEDRSYRPRRVAVEDAAPAPFLSDDDKSLDTSTTEDDIDAILNEIHNRHS